MTRPPKWLWLLAAAVAVLRALPFLATFVVPPPEGQAFLHVGYMPEDMHAYLSFIRQTSEEHRFFFENRYVAADQSGRFILLFHWLVGGLSAISRVPGPWMIELARLLLIFVFFGVVWWFLEPIFGQRSRGRERRWAVVLIGASGGIEGFLRPLAKRLPESIAQPFMVDTWPLNGWNTFESLYNPLWIAGLTLALLVLRRVLEPPSAHGGKGSFFGRLGPLDLTRILGVVVLFFVHPYSALVVLAIALALPLVRFLVEGTAEKRPIVGELVSMAAAVAIIAAATAWQRADPVFAASSGGFFGRLHLPVFWYPVTFAVVLALAVRGGVQWLETRHPYRSSIMTWVGVVVLLHTSNWINGYHFIPYLHFPLAILAASVMPALRQSLPRRPVARALAIAALLVTLFANPVLVTVEALSDLRSRNLVPKVFVDATSALAELPPGRVLAPPQMGLLIPAHTSHAVWAGHWFLTPEYWPKLGLYAQLIGDPAREDDLLRLVEDQRIDYLVVPASKGERLAASLGNRERRSMGSLELIRIER